VISVSLCVSFLFAEHDATVNSGLKQTRGGQLEDVHSQGVPLSIPETASRNNDITKPT
jgi:hypothetical protein